MNKTRQEALSFVSSCRPFIDFATEHGVDIGIAAPYLCLDVLTAFDHHLLVAAENAHYAPSGAFTGEISLPMLQEIGVHWCLVGHSERRLYAHETDKDCHQKILALLAADMTPLFCLGETEKEFAEGQTEAVIDRQLSVALQGLDPEKVKRIVIAYEPVWAIGTGRSASPLIAEKVAAHIRTVLARLYDRDVAMTIRILYGGSVRPDNIRAYVHQPDVDGALVGGASLSVESFHALVENII